MNKIKSIQLKIALWAGICLFLAAAIIIGYAALSLNTTASKAAEAEAMATAQSYASMIGAELEVPMDAVRTLAQASAIPGGQVEYNTSSVFVKHTR